VAEAALAKGVPTEVLFLGEETGRKLAEAHGRADLVVANNVFAHVPDIVDFAKGLRALVADHGRVTIEIPHLLRLIEGREYDTIYHEHYSYLSLLTVQQVLAAHGLEVVDVERLSTHGGSIRVHAQHVGAGTVGPAVDAVLADERAAGLDTLAPYLRFAEGVRACKRALLLHLIEAHDQGRTVAGYGAPAKATTLLNYCGVGPDLLEYTVDRSPHKQGRYVPGVRIPILAPEHIAETRPDEVLVLAWNLKDEIVRQMAQVREWGGRFAVPIPVVEVFG
jgi:hypothetical protein